MVHGLFIMMIVGGALVVGHRFFMVVGALVMVHGLFMMDDWVTVDGVMITISRVRVRITATAAYLKLLMFRLNGLSLYLRLGLLLFRGYLSGLWAAGTRTALMAGAVVVMSVLLVVAVALRV